MRLTIAACLLAVLMAAALGCQKSAKREVHASYTLPPRAVQDISQIQYLKVSASGIKVTGNYPAQSQDISTMVQNAVKQRIDSGIYHERFYLVVDDIYDNDDGLTQLRQILLKSRHGYEVKPKAQRNAALLSLSGNVVLSRGQGVDTVVTELVTVPYVVLHMDDDWQTPYSAANYAAQSVRTVTSKVPYTMVAAKGNLTAVLKDAGGKTVYNRTFDNLSFELKVGGTGEIGAEPTPMQVVAAMFEGPVQDIVADISPHKEFRSVKPNEDGDPMAVMLIKATAFSEAYRRLFEVLDEQEAAIIAREKEIGAEYDELMAQAESDEELADLRMEKDEELAEAAKILSPEYENLAITCEVMGRTGEAIEYYEQAVLADPDNETAADSLGRVSELAEQAKALGLEKGQDYREREHKER